MSLREQFEALTPAQRERLAKELARRYPALAPGDRRLRAFVKALPDAQADGEEIRQFLKARLPAPMVPESIMLLDKLPRTRGGKIDRRALEDFAPPAAERRDSEARSNAHSEPTSEKHTILAEIWKTVLDLDEVDVEDDFFEVGGDSLMSIRVLSRAARAGLKVTPEQFFERPTIAGMAAAAAAGDAPATQGAVEGDAPLTPIQHWFFENIPVDQHHWNQSVCLELDASVTADAVDKAVAALVEHHDALRTGFVRDSEGWRQIFGPSTAERILRVEPLERLATVAEELQSGTPLDAGSPARFALFEAEAGEPKTLLVVIHHLAVDNLSWSILLEDLESLLAGRSLPSKTAPYKQWSESLGARAGDPLILGPPAVTGWSRRR